LLEDAGILQTVIPTNVLAKCTGLDGQNAKTMGHELSAFRSDLIAERQQLIQQKLELNAPV
jgi:hypothetical protein